MRNLTDLELCKRIAEITEGKGDINCYHHEHDGICIDGMMCGMVFRQAYNPLTDDALNLQLRDKYCVEITYDGYCLIFDEEHFVEIVSVEWDNIKDINKTVCLAIIEANNDT